MPRLVVIKGPMLGQAFEFDGDTVFIGRSSKNDIQIKDVAISRKHLKIFKIGNSLFAEDLRSTNGTMINGKKIVPGEGFDLGEGDTMAIGHTVIRLDAVPARKALEVRPPAPQRHGTDSKEQEQATQERRARSGKELELIYRVSQLLRQSLSINGFLEKVLDYIKETLPRIDTAAILLFDTQGGQVKEVISKPKPEAGEDDIHYSRTVVDRVLREGKAIRMSNTTYEDPGDLSESMTALKLGSVMCVPMISNTQMLGVIYVDSLRGPYGFRKEDLLLLKTLSGPVAVAIEKAALVSQD